jgi:hypothetical protein
MPPAAHVGGKIAPIDPAVRMMSCNAAIATVKQ